MDWIAILCVLVGTSAAIALVLFVMYLVTSTIERLEKAEFELIKLRRDLKAIQSKQRTDHEIM